MTEVSGVCDNFAFNGNIIFVRSDDNEYMQTEPRVCYANTFFSGIEIINFIWADETVDFTSLIGNHMISTAIVVGEK